MEEPQLDERNGGAMWGRDLPLTLGKLLQPQRACKEGAPHTLPKKKGVPPPWHPFSSQGELRRESYR